MDNKGVCKTALDLATDSGNQSCRKLLLLWGGAPAEVRGPQRASSLPNLAAEIAEEGVEDKADEEDNEGKEEEDNANEIRLGMDQELCQRVKEMQNELSELRRDVLRLRKERSEISVIEAKVDSETEHVKMTENLNEESLKGQVFEKEVNSQNFGTELRNASAGLGQDIRPPEETFEGERLPRPTPSCDIETQCDLGADTISSFHLDTEDSGVQEEGVGYGLLSIPPLVLPSNPPSQQSHHTSTSKQPRHRSRQTSTASTRQSATQCNLETMFNTEEVGASISSRNPCIGIGGSRTHQLKPDFEGEGNSFASHHKQHLFSGTTQLAYDHEDRQIWVGEETEEVDERFQYSSDEEVPVQNNLIHMIDKTFQAGEEEEEEGCSVSVAGDKDSGFVEERRVRRQQCEVLVEIIADN